MVNAEALAKEIIKHLETEPTYAVAPGHNGFPEVDWTDIANLADHLPEQVIMLPWQQNGKLRVLVVSTHPVKAYEKFKETFQQTMAEYCDDPEAHDLLAQLRANIERHYDVKINVNLPGLGG